MTLGGEDSQVSTTSDCFFNRLINTRESPYLNFQFWSKHLSRFIRYLSYPALMMTLEPFIIRCIKRLSRQC